MRHGNTVGSLRQILSSSEQGEIIFGTVLGDGYLQKMKTGWRLEVSHSEKQKEYLFWKYKKLIKFTGAKPHLSKFFDKRFGKEYRQWRFKTKSSDFLSHFYTFFYGPKGKKEIRKEIVDLLKSPLSLAVWYMDDGGRRNDSYGVFLNSLSFSKKENQLLQKCLKENFFIDSRIHWVSDGYRIYIPSKEVKRFFSLVYPYIIPSMRYKLSYNPVTTSFARLDRARDRRKK